MLRQALIKLGEWLVRLGESARRDLREDLDLRLKSFQNGEFTLTMRRDYPALMVLAEEVGRFFDEQGGVNYVAFSMWTPKDKIYTMTVTPGFKGEKAVFEVNADLKRQLAEAQAAHARFQGEVEGRMDKVEARIAECGRQLAEAQADAAAKHVALEALADWVQRPDVPWENMEPTVDAALRGQGPEWAELADEVTRALDRVLRVAELEAKPETVVGLSLERYALAKAMQAGWLRKAKR